MAHCRALIEALGPRQFDVVEIAAGEAWAGMPFRSYRALNYPEHDICAGLPADLAGTADLVNAEQVFERLLRPYRAGRIVFSLLRPGLPDRRHPLGRRVGIMPRSRARAPPATRAR